MSRIMSPMLIPGPDGPGRAARLERALSGEAAALGPTVSVHESRRSLGWARCLLTLDQAGATAPRTGRSSGLIRTDDHLPEMILLRNRDLAALVAARLTPLVELGEIERERLERTLTAWFAHQRHTPSVAAELSVHPQTVRYRLGRLRELFGEVLDTPDARFELELALRLRQHHR